MVISIEKRANETVKQFEIRINSEVNKKINEWNMAHPQPFAPAPSQNHVTEADILSGAAKLRSGPEFIAHIRRSGLCLNSSFYLRDMFVSQDTAKYEYDLTVYKTKYAVWQKEYTTFNKAITSEAANLVESAIFEDAPKLLAKLKAFRAKGIEQF